MIAYQHPAARAVQVPSLLKPAVAPDPQARDPFAGGQGLMPIASVRPDMGPAVVAIPSTYLALLNWLRARCDPSLDVAPARERPWGARA